MTENYFTLFGMAPSQTLDAEDLKQRFYALAQQAHSVVQESTLSSEKRLASQLAATLNDAYKILKDPHSRAGYLAQCLQIDLNVQLPIDFLEQCMDWQSDIEDSRPESLPLLKASLCEQAKAKRLLIDNAFKALLELEGASAETQVKHRIALSLAQLNYIEPLIEKITDRIEDEVSDVV